MKFETADGHTRIYEIKRELLQKVVFD
jgi:hypothetical protein